MATIKSFTSLEQSRKLAEILPLESADMHYWLAWSGGASEEKRNTPRVGTPKKDAIKTYWCPCWSLAALLSVLPKNLNIGRPSLESNYKGYCWIQYYDEFMKPNNYKTECFNNSIDACVAMIEKLNELKIL